MVVSQYVNLKNLSDFLENEIKEITERWGQFTITKIALERVIANTKFTDEQMADYEKIKTLIEDKKKTDIPRFLSKVENTVKDNYDAVIKSQDNEKSLENAQKGLKEFEEFLEVAVELKKEIDQKLSTSSTSNTNIEYEVK